MDKLWAPWRMPLIREGMNGEECFLCEAGGSSDDAKRHVVARASSCFCILNLYPYSNGHLLIAPYRHEAALEALSRDEMDDFMALTIHAKKALDKACAPHGFNIGINLGRVAGAGLEDHIHLHIVPRWSGDTNFMTSIGSARVIPQALDEMWQLLTEVWESTG